MVTATQSTKAVIKKETCPKCGTDRSILAECLSSPVPEDRFTAWIILENCPECKKSMEAHN